MYMKLNLKTYQFAINLFGVQRGQEKGTKERSVINI